MENEDNNIIKVSVLCAAYNHENYIRQTLDGFVNQKTNFKFEVLIHDDASTDRTAAIISEYADQYPDLIKPIYQTENQYSKGVKIQRTYNYPRAQGRYIAWCEGDDYWCDEYKLQKQFVVMEAHPECSLCVHKVQCINEDGSKSNYTLPVKGYGIKQEGVLSDNIIAKAIWQKDIQIPLGIPFQLSSYFLRRETIKSYMDGLLPFESYFPGDLNLLRVAVNEGSFYYINQIMSCYRLLSVGSYTSRSKERSDIEKYMALPKRAEGELIYDEFSSGKFHDWIVYSINDKLLRCGAFDQALMDEFLEKHDWEIDEVLSHCSAKNRLKYSISKHAKPLYAFLRKRAVS